jgi:cation diffusion facilitator family transporter
VADQQQESRITVVLALAANLGIALAKIVAAVVTGSASLAAEAAHSVADTFNEVLLLAALRRSGRPADRRHPLGYGKERYFWSLLVAVAIFGMGALFAFVQGAGTLMGEAGPEDDALVGYAVLAVSFVLEAISWRQGLRQVRTDAADHGLDLRHYLRTTDEPTSISVLLEDTAALTGLILAFAGLSLHTLTGDAFWDGLASSLIGLVLTAVALLLGHLNKNLLIGNQADPRLVQAVKALLGGAPEVEWVVDVLTMTVGADRVLVCARLDFRDALTAAAMERACVRMEGELRAAHPEIDEVFLEPVPRDDPGLRQRVIERYGHPLGEQPEPAEPSQSPEKNRS